MQSAYDIPIEILILKLIFLLSHFFYFLWARLSAHTPTRAAPVSHYKSYEILNKPRSSINSIVGSEVGGGGLMTTNGDFWGLMGTKNHGDSG